jgi:hypothetical protein
MLEEDAAGTRPRLNPSSSGVLAEGEAGRALLRLNCKGIKNVVTLVVLLCAAWT